MNEKILQKFKEKLKKEKDNLEKQLGGFARKDPKATNNWKTKYPRFGGGLGSQGLEEAADEVEEYMALLPIEASLETKILDINSALGISQLKRLKKFIKIPERVKGFKETYALYMVLCKNRDKLKNFLEKNKIEVKIHYPKGLNNQPAFKKFNL